ncbi:MAG: hypothetical protein Q4C98_08800 [Capnocytophaga sp.]|nr:hypothetical protein [Capnocytophaga sp.]
MKTIQHIVFVLIISLSISCKKQIAEKDLALLNGYWEIEKVVLADKSVKVYQGNTTYDYIELKNNSGFRKKVYPQLFGKYQTNENAEFFTIAKKNDIWQMNYTVKNDQWIETLESLSEKSFVVKNSEGIEYFYKKVEE